jgi:hypothetical protein
MSRVKNFGKRFSKHTKVLLDNTNGEKGTIVESFKRVASALKMKDFSFLEVIL